MRRLHIAKPTLGDWLTLVVLSPILSLPILVWIASQPPPPINISGEQYDASLARWRSQGIEQYEITVDLVSRLGHKTTLRASEHGGAIEILSPSGVATPEPEFMDLYKEDTIEGMFEEINLMLEGKSIIHTSGMYSTGPFYMAYQIRFDPTFGYPSSIEAQPVTKPGVHVYDTDWKKTVTSFKVLKRSTPAAP